MQVCPKCGYVRSPEDAAPESECPRCGVIYAKAGHKRSLTEMRLDHAQSVGHLWDMSADDREKIVAGVALATTEHVHGRVIAKSFGVVFGESGLAFGAIEEIVGGAFRNIAGTGHSGRMTSRLHQVRQEALVNLRASAVVMGGDAVVGVRVDVEEFSGANGRGILVVVASGTAVRLAPPGT